MAEVPVKFPVQAGHLGGSGMCGWNPMRLVTLYANTVTAEDLIFGHSHTLGDLVSSEDGADLTMLEEQGRPTPQSVCKPYSKI